MHNFINFEDYFIGKMGFSSDAASKFSGIARLVVEYAVLREIDFQGEVCVVPNNTPVRMNFAAKSMMVQSIKIREDVDAVTLFNRVATELRAMQKRKTPKQDKDAVLQAEKFAAALRGKFQHVEAQNIMRLASESGRLKAIIR